MMLDPNYRTSFENIQALINRSKSNERLHQAYQGLFSADSKQPMTQYLALQLESSYGGEEGFKALEDILLATQGLGVDAVQQAILHSASADYSMSTIKPQSPDPQKHEPFSSTYEP